MPTQYRSSGLTSFFCGSLLQQEADLALRAHGFLRGRDRARAADRDRRDDAREEHGVPHRDEDQRVFRHRLQVAGARRRAAAAFISSWILRQHSLVHAPSFFLKTRVSTPSASVFVDELERRVRIAERQCRSGARSGRRGSRCDGR